VLTDEGLRNNMRSPIHLWLELGTMASHSLSTLVLLLATGLAACVWSEEKAAIPPHISLGDPYVVIGNDEETLLWDPSSVAFTSSGNVIVADLDMRVKVFDDQGRPKVTFGKAGSGPGEFRRLAWAYPLADDTIMAYDSELGRFQLFSPDGTYLRQLRVPEIAAFTLLTGATARGTVVGFQIPVVRDLDREGWGRTPIVEFQYDMDGNVRFDTLWIPIWLRCDPAHPGRCAPLNPPARQRGELTIGSDAVLALPADELAVYSRWSGAQDSTVPPISLSGIPDRRSVQGLVTADGFDVWVRWLNADSANVISRYTDEGMKESFVLPAGARLVAATAGRIAVIRDAMLEIHRTQ
jgi:hypothetical protein